MGGLSILSRDEALARNLPWPDVYFTPGYGAAVEVAGPERSPWHTAVWEPGPILFPFLIEREADGARKASSPYGYAGTWAPPEVPVTAFRDFRAALRAALADLGVSREFQRLSALVPGRERLLEADPALHGRHHNDTVGIDLAGGYDTCWAAAESRSRTKTRKARKLGYTAVCRPAAPADLEAGGVFRDLYDATMQRVEARAYYHFSSAYYAALRNGLGGALHIVDVRDPGGAPGAAGLFMPFAPRVHLHLVGSTREAQRDGAGNLLYDAVIAWGCEAGLELLHVGGGMARDDDMFYFKRSFGGHRLPFWIANGTIP